MGNLGPVIQLNRNSYEGFQTFIHSGNTEFFAMHLLDYDFALKKSLTIRRSQSIVVTAFHPIASIAFIAKECSVFKACSATQTTNQHIVYSVQCTLYRPHVKRICRRPTDETKFDPLQPNFLFWLLIFLFHFLFLANSSIDWMNGRWCLN